MGASRLDISMLLASFVEVAESTHYTEGKFVRKFEELASVEHGMEAVAYNSAGTALFAVLKALKASKVIVPNNTFYATGGMAVEAGCTVTLADCSTEDFCMSLDTLKAVYTDQDTVILAHIGGHLANDYALIAQWCLEHNVNLVEDAAHAFGLLGVKAGSLGTAAVFSFYPTKSVPVGEGGLVVTRDANLAEYVRRYRNYGKYMDAGVLKYTGMGFNFRMDEWTAAVACHQFNRLDEIRSLRAEDAYRLLDHFQPLLSVGDTNWYKFIVSSDVKAKRNAGMVYHVSDQLRSMPNLRDMEHQFPGSDWVSANHVCLPIGEGIYQGMSDIGLLKYVLGDDYASA